jgi:putative tricarboxylic transport membrane protein
VELVNWRGLMAPEGMRERDKAALDEALGKMVRSEPWQAILQERGWVDMYQPSDQFAAFLEGEQTRIEGILKDLGLAQ